MKNFFFFIFHFRFFVIFFFIFFSLFSICVTVEVTPIIEGPTVAPLGCHRRLYTYRITQADENGYECWDNVSVWSCWGRCDSNEISDWKFPYKRSFHPVCVHSGRSKAVATLRNCHPKADPNTKSYEYLEAIACNCQACSSTDTSCEAPKLVHGDTAVKVLAISGQGDDSDYE